MNWIWMLLGLLGLLFLGGVIYVVVDVARSLDLIVSSDEDGGDL